MTSPGNLRDINEDAFLNAPGRGLWAVADGMGGHDDGNVASEMIVQTLGGLVAAERGVVPVDRVQNALEEVNSRLYAKAGSADSSSTCGSTVAVMVADGGYCICLWAGDSRIYRLRDFLLTQLTRDHSEVEFLIAERGLSRDEAQRHPDANIVTRAIGGEEKISLELYRDRVKTRDRYLLCSDGLNKELSAEEIAQILSRGSCTDACRNLVQCALSRRCADNVTVVAVDFEETEQ